MSYSISKELFEAVMDGYEYISPHNGGIICCWKDSDGLHNEKVIYPNDFFFKCKEWALEQGYFIKSETGLAIVGTLGSRQYCYDRAEDSEQQAVFDACQWILENTDG